MKIIAVDFDCTLCENKFPQIGDVKIEVINKLKQEQDKGTKIILWTCREEGLLEAAVTWCKEQGLFFDAVNDNLPETLEWMIYNSRKIYADEYWDDKANREELEII